jgi:hypothetical protein
VGVWALICSNLGQGFLIVCNQQMVFLERLDKFTQICRCRNALDPKLDRELIRDFGLHQALLQEFKDPRSNEIEAEHLPAANVEDGCSVRTMRSTHIRGDAEGPLTPDLWLSGSQVAGWIRVHCDLRSFLGIALMLGNAISPLFGNAKRWHH